MSAGDITRLNRMYNCPDFGASIAVNNATTTNPTPLAQFTNGVTVKKGVNKSEDKTSSSVGAKDEMELNLNDTITNDDDDMMLSKEQIDALYSSNAAKRNGLKSAFHYWPLGTVAFEIDPNFSKDFTAFYIYLLLLLRSVRSSIAFPSLASREKNIVKREERRHRVVCMLQPKWGCLKIKNSVAPRTWLTTCTTLRAKQNNIKNKLNLFCRSRIHFNNLRVHGLHQESLVYTLHPKDAVQSKLYLHYEGQGLQLGSRHETHRKTIDEYKWGALSTRKNYSWAFALSWLPTHAHSEVSARLESVVTSVDETS